jgi:hypothetical protein
VSWVPAGEPAYRVAMTSFEDVARVVTDLPEVTAGERHGHRTWFVHGRGFAWERPFSKADLKRFGEVAPPSGPILAVKVGDLSEKEAVLAARPAGFFTIVHFDGFPAVLIQLDEVDPARLREAIEDAWLACAPPELAERYLAGRG